MRESCLTEDVIQQFIDGELSAEQTESAAAHLAACDRCAALLSEVEQESSLLMEAFAPEMSLSVPTLRLRERLDTAIAELAPRPKVAAGSSASSRIRGWFGSLFGASLFTPQHALGFASLAVVVVFAGIFAVIQLREGGNTTTPSGSVAVKKDEPAKAPSSTEAPLPKPTEEKPVAAASTPEIVKAGSVPAQRRNVAKPVINKIEAPSAVVKEQPTAPRLLPGERDYLEAIASLSTAIDTNKDDVLRPTVRAEYERNLAVVDQAIASTRAQAKRNPKDRDAVEFMYMAYQNKIELLSAVADQTRLASR